jgi:hypothetical protein
MKRIRKKQSHRYYCQNALKGKYPVDGRKKTIKLPYNRFDEIPKPDRWYVGELIKYGYLVQFELLDVPATGSADPINTIVKIRRPRNKQQLINQLTLL